MHRYFGSRPKPSRSRSASVATTASGSRSYSARRRIKSRINGASSLLALRMLSIVLVGNCHASSLLVRRGRWFALVGHLRWLEHRTTLLDFSFFQLLCSHYSPPAQSIQSVSIQIDSTGANQRNELGFQTPPRLHTSEPSDISKPARNISIRVGS